VKGIPVPFIVAGILCAIGLGLLPASFHWGPVNYVASVPSGSFIHVVQFEMYSGGILNIEYEVSSGGSVSFALWKHGKFWDWRYNGAPFSAMYSSDSGTFDRIKMQVSEPGTYLIVFGHGPENGSALQEVRVSYEADALNPFALGVSIGALATGAVVVVIGAWIRGKNRPRATVRLERGTRPSSEGERDDLEGSPRGRV